MSVPGPISTWNGQGSHGERGNRSDVDKIIPGKGLGACFRNCSNGSTNGPPISCAASRADPQSIPGPEFLRDQEQKNLVASIRKSGVIQPIVVRRAAEGYEIIAGERRWRAAQQAGLKEVPVVIREAGDLDAAEWSIVENIQRESLNPVEEAEAFRILADKFGLSQEDIALRVAKDRSTVANSLRLLRLPAEILDGLVARKTLRFMPVAFSPWNSPRSSFRRTGLSSSER